MLCLILSGSWVNHTKLQGICMGDIYTKHSNSVYRSESSSPALSDEELSVCFLVYSINCIRYSRQALCACMCVRVDNEWWVW